MSKLFCILGEQERIELRNSIAFSEKEIQAIRLDIAEQKNKLKELNSTQRNVVSK